MIQTYCSCIFRLNLIILHGMIKFKSKRNYFGKDVQSLIDCHTLNNQHIWTNYTLFESSWSALFKNGVIHLIPNFAEFWKFRKYNHFLPSVTSEICIWYSQDLFQWILHPSKHIFWYKNHQNRLFRSDFTGIHWNKTLKFLFTYFCKNISKEYIFKN